MRTAPPADYPVSCEGPWQYLGLTLMMVTAAVVAAWVASQLALSIAPLALGAACATGLLAWRVWAVRRRPAMRLRWDGQAWRLTSPADLSFEDSPGAVRVVLDLGDGLLLRWVEPGGKRVRLLPLWRERDQVPAWHALRVAVQAVRTAA
jgi:hypothetical protein